MDNEQKETHGPDERTNLTRREFIKGIGIGGGAVVLFGRFGVHGWHAFTIGPKKGSVLDRNQFDAMLTRYYKDRGWDPETTRPGKLKLKELGLDSI